MCKFTAIYSTTIFGFVLIMLSPSPVIMLEEQSGLRLAFGP